jgi:hypothetical protein
VPSLVVYRYRLTPVTCTMADSGKMRHTRTSSTLAQEFGLLCPTQPVSLPAGHWPVLHTSTMRSVTPAITSIQGLLQLVQANHSSPHWALHSHNWGGGVGVTVDTAGAPT